METDSALSAVALAVSLGLFAAASLGEASIGSVRRERLQTLVSEGVSGSATLERLHALPMGPTGALSVASVLFVSAAVVSAVALVISSAGANWFVIGPMSLTALVSLGVVHVAARMLASARGEEIATRFAMVARLLAWLLNPILTAQALLVQRASRQFAIQNGVAPELVPTEIDLPLEAAGEPLDEREVRMIRGVVQLHMTIAREIMVPRVDVVAAEAGTPIADLAELMVKGGHSKIPVYRDDLDHVEGIAYARDLLRHLARDEMPSTAQVENVIRPALFIPESKTLEELLNEFQQKHVHIAIVVDEYGGVSGLVTIEDLLEEIVGEIQDEFDVGDPEVEPIGDLAFMMDARVGIDQLNELLRVSVEGAGFDTVGGFVYERLGRIPSPGDTVEYDGLSIEVISTAGRRLKRLRVTRALGREPSDS